jgi:anti-sigma regulatory factor (Ser/Thr protein kinase)
VPPLLPSRSDGPGRRLRGWGGEVKQIEVRILNRREDLALVNGAVERFAAENGITGGTLHDLNVALDEALSNIISYAFEKDIDSEIAIRMEQLPGEVVIVIEDRGSPFDPTQGALPDMTAPLHARKVGGLGVHFIRSLMDEVSYARNDGVNTLRLMKRTVA